MHLQQHLLTRLRAWQGHRASLCPWSEVMESAGPVASSWANPMAGQGRLVLSPTPRGAAGGSLLLLPSGSSACVPPYASCSTRSPHFFCFVEVMASWRSQTGGLLAAAHLLFLFPSGAWDMPPLTLPAWVTMDEPVVLFGGIACMESGLGLVPSSALR